MKNTIVAMSLMALGAVSGNAVAGWEPVEGDELKALVSNTTWEGKGFTLYWYPDGTRKLISATGDRAGSWRITDDGKWICAETDGDGGERCGVIEVKEHKKKEKTKWRSTRTKPKTGKRFFFKVIDGVNE